MLLRKVTLVDDSNRRISKLLHDLEFEDCFTKKMTEDVVLMYRNYNIETQK